MNEKAGHVFKEGRVTQCAIRLTQLVRFDIEFQETQCGCLSRDLPPVHSIEDKARQFRIREAVLDMIDEDIRI